MIRKLVLAASLLAPLAATAQELPTAPYLPLDLAVKAADAALNACVAEGHNVSVAVTARDGATKVLLKADNSGPHTVTSAQGKAFTSDAMGRDTGGLAEFIASKPSNEDRRRLRGCRTEGDWRGPVRARRDRHSELRAKLLTNKEANFARSSACALFANPE